MPEPASTDTTTERSGYWNDFYAGAATAARPLPSQFAAFVAGELDRPHHVIEFGCGSGRDAMFFSSYGHRVTGVDSSEMAVKACRELASGLGESATFVAAAVDSENLPADLDLGPGPVAVYARFFIHAITEAEEQSFLDLAARLTSTADVLAVEYRTVRDLSGAKVTGRHYRRFVNPATFQARALDRGFDVTYAVEGFGFAKYKQDDAYVARTIFAKR